MQTYGKGAKGFLIVELQDALQRAIGRRLPHGSDGKYGGEVMSGVKEFAEAQPLVIKEVMRRERAMFGQAGPTVWRELGLEWPELFARCLLLTAGFEGTGFSGSCGPKDTGDTAGVTFGLVGFTSFNGELQELLRVASVDSPDQFEYVGSGVLGVSPYYTMLELIKADEEPRAFERWALSGGAVRPSVAQWLAALGELPWMRHLEMQSAYTRYWTIARRQAGTLFDGRATDRAHALMFDIAVQNGGLKAREIDDLLWTFKHGDLLTETDQMHAINTRLVERLRAADRPAKIVDDVRSRKGTIARGSGAVHGSDWIIRSFAL